MVFNKFFGKKDAPQAEGEIDIENYLNDLSIREGKIIEREDIIYVKPIDIDSEGKGIGLVIKELEKGNIVILNVRDLAHNKMLLRNVVKELKETVDELEGDIVRLAGDKILLSPSGIKVVHKEAAQGE